MTYERRNKGTCSVMTKVELNPDHTIESVEVLGGCNGNLKGICQLLKGMKAEDAIERHPVRLQAHQLPGPDRHYAGRSPAEAVSPEYYL